eukprot:CAMPEP_0184653154 /NCGR_PEP_ID=MMETSP0308-20130426/10881_1 /TAXON_ID=38269 /ORGANISM="Gloeochaete witrockiana, Strain SAG 46.84" /LENGTH=175 /DNA_ID=CAMNT_0027088487 /DNA_START=1193 /DNA_END=1720 /DNA_ORIENTATION=+
MKKFNWEIFRRKASPSIENKTSVKKKSAPSRKPKTENGILSSLPLQVFLYFNIWFVVGYVIYSIVIWIYKEQNFGAAYTSASLGIEIAASFIAVPLVDGARINVGMSANILEKTPGTLWFLGLTLVTSAWYIYAVWFQTITLHVDVAVNLVALIFQGLEFILGIFAAATFFRHTT